MAVKICIKCKEEKTTAHYIAVNSPLHSGSLPVCRECLYKFLAAATDEEKWNRMDKICQWADVPFIPSEWEKISLNNEKNAIGTYIAIFRNQGYDTLDWSSYNKVYKQLKEEEQLEVAIPEIRDKKERELRKKWGQDYDDEELEYLENLHQGLITSQNIVGALNEDQALKLCKISLIIESKIRGGQDFTKDLKAYDDLVKLSNFTPKNVKDANEFDSFGEVFAYLEKTGWVNKYYDDAARDEIDFTIKNLKNWVRYLYVNETGVGEEIEQRINNLKIAAELQNEEFNEEEFRDYLSGEEKIDKEEFKIELEE